MLNFFEGTDAATEGWMRDEMDAEALNPPCTICQGYAPCDCDVLKLAGLAEVERLWGENGTVSQ